MGREFVRKRILDGTQRSKDLTLSLRSLQTGATVKPLDGLVRSSLSLDYEVRI